MIKTKQNDLKQDLNEHLWISHTVSKINNDGQEWSQLWVDVMCAVGDYDESAIEINGDAKEV